jgi:hypothetical protein
MPGALSGRAANIARMTDMDRAKAEFLRSLLEYDRAAEASPRTERVLPADLDLDAELDRRFAEPGVGVWVAVV